MIKIFFLSLVLFCGVTIGFVYHANSGLEGQRLEYNAQLQSLLLQGLKYEQATTVLAQRGIQADNPKVKEDLISFINHALETIRLPKLFE